MSPGDRAAIHARAAGTTVQPWELSPLPREQRAKIIEHAAAMYDRGHADALTSLRSELSHHLTPDSDPCQDRGVGWPCDVADALTDVR